MKFFVLFFKESMNRRGEKREGEREDPKQAHTADAEPRVS